MKKAAIPLTIAWIFMALPAHARDLLIPPPLRFATVNFEPPKGQLQVLYGQQVIMDVAVTLVDSRGNVFAFEKMGLGHDFKFETSREARTQYVRFSADKLPKGVKVVLQGNVFGSEEAFPAEATRGKAQERFPYVRTCNGLSRNLRNNAVYDRDQDWVLSGPAGHTRIIPRKTQDGVDFEIQCQGRNVELVFKPRFYQMHKNLPYFEPWNYKVWKDSISGYCTWWAYREAGGLDQNKLDQVLEVFERKHLVDFGYKILQIDAGWSTGQGPRGMLNWNDRFPGGPQRAVERIRRIGMTPGLHTWVVFRPGDPIVDGLVKEHPDWFLRKPDGTVLNRGTYTLNPFNDDALDRLIRPTYKGLKEQGWEYVKIDGQGDLMAFCYSQYPEFFAQRKTTPAEALRRLNRAAREELGDDLFVLGCWSVRTELAGIVNGCRLGRDSFGPAELQYFNSYNGVVWRNDPDHCDIWPLWLEKGSLPWFMECVGAKPDGPKPDSFEGTNVSDTIVRPCVVSMAGGMLMLSDKAEVYDNDAYLEGIKRSAPVLFSVPGQLYDYNPLESDRIRDNVTDNLERLPEPRLHMRHAQIPHAPHHGKQSPWWMLEIDKPFENWSVLARFNWRKLSNHWDRATQPAKEVRFSDLGLSDEKEYLVYEFWSRKFLGRKKRAFLAPFQTPEDGLHVFSIREAKDHPWVISTSRHISQGGVDLANLRWDAGENALVGESAVVQEDPYQIAVYVPQNFRLLAAKSSLTDPRIEQHDEYITATIVPETTGSVNWRLTFAEQE